MYFAENDNNKILFAGDSKFKNFKVVLSFKTPLDKKAATLNALLVKVLIDGCEKYKTKKEISVALKKLYGSAMSSRCIKKEFCFCPTFELDCLSEKFSDKNIISDIFNLFKEILFMPLLEDGAFKKEYVEREKKVLKNDIESASNDKRRYAERKCLEMICGDNPYGLFELGDADFCGEITPAMLYEHYKYIISSCAYTVLAVGNFDNEIMKNEVSILCGKLGKGEDFKGEKVLINGSEKVQKEESDITQGKLSMGFKTGEIKDEDKYSWQVLNGLFGGGVSSKLFNVVREKMSLCYYASSGLNTNIGAIFANAGIDFENFEKTVSAIKDQLQDIVRGNFTDEEFANVKTGIINNLKMADDDIDLLSNYYLFQMEKEELVTPLEKAEKISEVKRDNIPSLAGQVKSEAVYFLCGRGEAQK